MATRKKKPETEPKETLAEFDITLDEYLASIPVRQIESGRAFGKLMRAEGVLKKRQRTAWESLFVRFMRKPTSIPWSEWAKKGGN